MEIPSKIKDEIWDYCRANSITNIDEFTLKLIKQGFTVEKFGATPVAPIIKEKIVEVEKEVEKIVEVEKIIEKIVEVPVEKEVFVSDNSEMKKLTKEIDKLNKIIQVTSENKDKALSELAALEIENKKLKIDLDIEKSKKKRDIYGE